MTAFRASYADWKLIKTRACVQIVFELPVEQADAAYQLLGGMPVAAREVWCGIARLDKTKAADPPRLESNASAGADKPAKSPAQIAGYLCTLPSFQKFLQEKFSDHWYNNQTRIPEEGKIAAECVREICTVGSRREITKDNAEWSALRLAFMLWEKEAEVVPA